MTVMEARVNIGRQSNPSPIEIFRMDKNGSKRLMSIQNQNNYILEREELFTVINRILN